MFEMAEYITLAKQANAALKGKVVQAGSLGNSPHKFVWYNRSHEEFAQLTEGKTVGEAAARGRWLFIQLEPGYVLVFGECGGKFLLYMGRFHQRSASRAEAGVGYRLLWEVPNIGPTLTTHGFDVGKLRAGIDFRMDENVAIGPMIGADATLFLFQDFPNVQTNISDPTVSTFVYAGLQGRFDIGGQTTTAPRTVAQR